MEGFPGVLFPIHTRINDKGMPEKQCYDQKKRYLMCNHPNFTILDIILKEKI